MQNFKYIKAKAVEEAIKTVSLGTGSQFIAGGTNLIDLMKYQVETPDLLIDITNLALAEIEKAENGGLRLGALVTNADTAYHKEVENRYPLVSEAILSGASAQLRNAATNGGNLLQRTRCYYFYDIATPCNKREPGSGCSAIDGFNRIHAILGTSESCIATHPSDLCVALAALGATVNVKGKDGERIIPFLEFHRLPGDQPHMDSNLKEDEIITSIDLPNEDFSQNFSYLKVRDRPSYAFAIVSVAAALQLEGNKIRQIRVALGGVAHKPWRNTKAENNLKGQQASEENFAKLADEILEGAKGFGDNDFKIKLAKKTIVRALIQAVGN